MTIGKMTRFHPGDSYKDRLHPEYIALPSRPRFQGAATASGFGKNILVIGFCQEDT